MDKETEFTSTGFKLIHHPEVIEEIKKTGKIRPISLQIAPTSRCNLNCVFCSNANRTKHEELSVQHLLEFLERMRELGAKTVEWTGGGDPTMYEGINYVMNWAKYLGYEQGMISNGILVNQKINRKDFLKWLRISMNTLDYRGEVDLELQEFSGTLGFSYVWNEKTTEDVLKLLDAHVKKYNPAYVRIVPDCQATMEEQEENNRKLSDLVSRMGDPYFYQSKHFNSGDNCWWAYFKPFVLHDGYIYPCSSVVLNTRSDYTFHKRYRWCKMEELAEKYDKQAIPLKVKYCDHCVFKKQNDLVEEIVNPSEMRNFV